MKQEYICMEQQYSRLSVQKCPSLCRLHSDRLNICPCVDAVRITFTIKNIAGGKILARCIKPCHMCPEMQAEEIGLLSPC